MPLVVTMSLKTLRARASPMSVKMPASQSESSCSMPIFPFHFGFASSSHVFGRSCFLTCLRVVRLHEYVQPRPHPLAVRKDGRRDQVGQIRDS